MAHTIVLAGSAHRCRGCRQLYAPSELVFGQEIRDRFTDSPNAMTHLWFHLPCAAQLRPNVLRATLAQYRGPLPDRELVQQILAKQAQAPLLSVQLGQQLTRSVHPLLAGVSGRFPQQNWPAPIHLGGDVPTLSSRRHPQSLWVPAGAARIAVWCAHQVAALGGSGDELEKLALLQRCLAERDDERLHPKAKQGLHHNPFAQALSKLSPSGSVEPVSLSALEAIARFQDARSSALMRLITQAALQCLCTVSIAKFTADATECSTDAALFIATQAPDELPAFLAGLDQQLLVQEAQAAFDERAPSHLPVWRVWWRHEGQLAVELEDGGYALLVKLKARWRVFTGDRDEVLANVPDEQFGDAAAALFGDAVSAS